MKQIESPALVAQRRRRVEAPRGHRADKRGRMKTINCTRTPGLCVVHDPAITVRSKAAFYDACRKLAEAGHGSAALQAHDARGLPSIRAASIQHAAGWTVRETDDQGPRMVRWTPFAGSRWGQKWGGNGGGRYGGSGEGRTDAPGLAPEAA